MVHCANLVNEWMFFYVPIFCLAVFLTLLSKEYCNYSVASPQDLAKSTRIIYTIHIKYGV
jgi:hypothetical protein